MRFTIKLDRDSLLKYAIIFNLAYASISTLAYSFFGSTRLLRNVMIFLLLWITLLSVKKNIGRIGILFKIMLVMSFFLGVTYVFFPLNQVVIDSILIDVFKYTLLAFLISIASSAVLHDSMKKGAYCIFFCNLFEPITLFVTGEHNGYMVYGMRVMLATILLGFYYFEERKRSHLLTMVFSMVLILLYGNRSALIISLLCFIIQFLFRGSAANRLIHTIQTGLVVVLGIILLSPEIISVLSNFLMKIGVSSRTLLILQSGIDDFMNNNGRSIIWENSIQAIIEKPWIGYGIGGDRNLNLLGINYMYEETGIYAHNMFLEILLNFGIVLGTLFLMFLFVSCIKVLFGKVENEVKRLFSVIFIATFCKLMFSSTIWSEMNTYLCLGLVLNYCLKNKWEKNNVKRLGENKYKVYVS